MTGAFFLTVILQLVSATEAAVKSWFGRVVVSYSFIVHMLVCMYVYSK